MYLSIYKNNQERVENKALDERQWAKAQSGVRNGANQYVKSNKLFSPVPWPITLGKVKRT